MDDARCDLVLLSWNHLEETKPCLESLFRTTDVPARLIIVDNGSEPHIREFLRNVRPQGAIREVTLIQNDINRGFPGGMNQGLHASRAAYVCLLNNDLLFTSGWLSRMLEVAQTHPNIGVLNPSSSTLGDHPPSGMSLEAYAKQLEAAKRGLYVEVGMCIGFCMLIKRHVIEQIGLLTEEIERIFFEDEDYCMRAQASGFRSVVVSGAYVYHAEHRTVKRMEEREHLFQRNRQWCEAKWGRWLRVAYPRFTPVQPGTPELRAWLEELISWARKRTYVYVYCPTATGLTKDELFRSVGLVPHADVLWHPLPARLPRLTAVGAILKRQKKRFDAIVAPDEPWAALMRRLRWAHRANVVLASGTDELSRLWQIRAPSLS